MAKDSKSNREKIYTTGGTPFFGKVYGCSALPQSPPEPIVVACPGGGSSSSCGGGGSVDVFLTKYTATAIIWKSPASRCNKNKICSKGKTLYVLGDVCAANCGDGDSEAKEYLVFSEESWVFKRTWQELAGLVVPAGSTVWHMGVTGTGKVKDRLPQWILSSPAEGRCDDGSSSSNGNNNSNITISSNENNGGGGDGDVSEVCSVKTDENEGADEGKMKSVGEMKKGWREGRRHRRGEGTVQALRVQFTTNPMSAVWFTDSGLKHMAALVASYQSSLRCVIQCGHAQEEGEVESLLEPSHST